MNKKDAYYFSHDSNAQDDPKCMMLIDQLGMEGYGIFWALIEKLRCEAEYKLPLIVCKSYAKRWGTSEQKILTTISDFGLFVIENNMFFSLRLKDSMLLKSEKARKSAYLRWGNNANALPPHNECNANAMRNDAIKKKESKVKKSKVNNNINIINAVSSENLKKSILEFYEYRKEIKKPLSERSLQKTIIQLSNYDENIAVEMINQTIRNGWQGLFELKLQKNINTNEKRSKLENLQAGSDELEQMIEAKYGRTGSI